MENTQINPQLEKPEESQVAQENNDNENAENSNAGEFVEKADSQNLVETMENVENTASAEADDVANAQNAGNAENAQNTQNAENVDSAEKEKNDKLIAEWENYGKDIDNADNFAQAENVNFSQTEDSADDEESSKPDFTEHDLAVEKQQPTKQMANAARQSVNDMLNQAAKGVRTLNKNPMYLVAFAIFLFLVFMSYSAIQTANRSMGNGKKETQTTSNTSSVYAEKLSKNRGNGLISDGSRKDFAFAPPPQPIIKAESEQKAEKPSLDEVLNGVRVEPLNPVVVLDEESQQLRAMRMRNLQNATVAQSSVQIGNYLAEKSKRNNSAQNSTQSLEAQILALKQKENTEFFDAQKSFQNGMDRLNALRSPQGIASLGAGNLNQNNTNSARNVNVSANDSAINDRWYLGNKMQNPRSDFELRAGSVIPATLITGINSELGGQIIGQVSQNVFDTPTGDYLLIPQGSRLVGIYASDVAYGQSRVLVTWQRIVFPDGKALDIGAMSGADSAGYAGFNDKVDNHYLRIFGSAILMSMITAGVTYSQDSWSGSSSNNQRASDALSEALGQQLGTVTSQMIQKNLNISPTLTIREGFRFNVVVSKDLTFDKPYEPFDY